MGMSFSRKSSAAGKVKAFRWQFQSMRYHESGDEIDRKGSNIAALCHVNEFIN